MDNWVFRRPFDYRFKRLRVSLYPPVGVSANGAVSVAMAVAGQTGTHADGFVTLSLSVAARGGLQGAVSVAMSVAGVVASPTTDGSVTLSLSVAARGGLQGAVSIVMAVAGQTGTHADGFVTLSLSVAARGGLQGAVSATMAVSGQTGVPVDGAVIATMFVASTGTVIIHAAGSVTMTLSVIGGGTNPIHLVPQPNLPCLSVDGTLISNGGISAVLTVPMVRVSGSVNNGTAGALTVWSVNTETFGHTNYDIGYNFVDLMMWNRLPFGIKSDGIYELVGSNDVGVAIDTEFQFGIDDGSPSGRSTDFNKRVDVVYMSGRMDNDLIVTVTIDGQSLVREYTTARRMVASGVHDSRTKPAKGLRGRYWQFGVKNVAGGDFELDRMSVVYRTLKRKT